MPAAASLQAGELAVNLADQKLYSKTAGGTVVQVGFGNLTSAMVTTALGFTPYNSTNPSGYITASGSITASSCPVPFDRYTKPISADISSMAKPMVKKAWVCTTREARPGEMCPFMAMNSIPN